MVSSLCLFYSFLFSSFRVVMLLQMAGVKYSMLKSLSNTISLSLSAPTIHCYGSIRNCTTVDRISHVRPLASWMNRSNYSATSIKLYQLGRQAHIHGQTSINYSGISQVLLNSHVRCSLPLLKQSPVLSCRNFSSNSSNPVDNSKGLKVSEASGTNGGDANVSDGIMGSEWIDKLKDVSQSAMDTLVNTGQNAKESSDKLSSYAQEFLDSYPYLKDVIVPVGGTLTATLMAWLIMPRILRRFHKYSQQGSAALLPGSIMSVEVPYEKSFWGALEDPVRYLVTFIAFSQIAMMVAPNAIGPQYVLQAWSGASVMSLVWIIHRWKTNVLSRALAAQGMHKVDREKLLTVDRISSVGLFIIGLMALAEACGVAVQSILTVGGVGGVATAFAARDVLGNVLSGLSVQFSKPFSLGDTIKAGSVEGQVVEIGLTTTSLLNAEKFPVIVPNSLFASQVIINKSRAQWRAFVTKIPISIDNLETVPCISEDIKSMLKSNPKVFLGKETPYCFLSQIGSPFAELTLGCNLNHMSKDDLYSAGQDILIQSTKIIKQHGATIGSIWQNVPS